MSNVRKKSLNELSAQFNRILEQVRSGYKGKFKCPMASRVIDAYESSMEIRNLGPMSERTKKVGTGKFK